MTSRNLIVTLVFLVTLVACKGEKKKKPSAGKPIITKANSTEVFESWNGKSSKKVDLTKDISLDLLP